MCYGCLYTLSYWGRRFWCHVGSGWRRGQDSNPRLAIYETAAVAAEPPLRFG